MEKRKWLWKRKSSERSSGETESSGSMSSPSERYSDEQENIKESPNNDSQSPEVTSKAVLVDDEVKGGVKSLTEKLSAALVNVSAKEDLVKQHAKVAEEAVAGWEKAENEVAVLKQQLEAAVQHNVSLEVRVSHLDAALKECVRQLRQAKEEQEHRIHDAVVIKNCEWESVKRELENKTQELQIHREAAKAEYPAPVDPNISLKLDSLEKENSMLKAELLFRSEELEIRTIERDLSTQAAETASKQQLESIKKLAKLEAECRRLQSSARKFSTANDQKSAASSIYVESLTDGLSDSGEQSNAVDIDSREKSKIDHCESVASCSNSWASALIAELDKVKNEKATTKSLTACSVEIDIMDDFLEMERLAALPEAKNKISSTGLRAVANNSTISESAMKTELENMSKHVAELGEKLERVEAEKAELENITSHMSELKEKLQKMEVENAELQNMARRLVELEETLVNIETEKAELEVALNQSQNSLRVSQTQLGEAEIRLQELQKELTSMNETKESVEYQLIGMEAEARTMAANIDSLNAEVIKQKDSSAELAAKCQNLENELERKSQEVELQQTASSHHDVKIKQEDLAMAADKLAECQKTIASLGRQLESLATLEDFLIDTANLPGFSGGASLVSKARGESWKLHLNDTFVPRSDSDPSKTPGEVANHSLNGNDGESPPSSLSSTSSTNHPSKSRNGFGKLFSRSSRNGFQVENQG